MDHKKNAGVLRSQSSNVFLLKLWAPLLLICGTIGVFGDHPFSASLVLSLPLLTLAIFQLSLAQMELRNNVLRYRRVVTWQTISPGEIVASGVVWPGFIGYVRFRHYFPPFGLLYFVLDANSDANPFRQGSYPLLCQLGGATPTVLLTPSKVSRSKSQNRIVKIFGVAAVGVLVTLVRIHLSGPASQEARVPPGVPGIVSPLFQTFHSLAINLILVLVLGVLAFRTNDNRKALVYAFVGGLFVPLIWIGR